MKLEAIKRQQGERTDLTSVPVGQKSESKSSREIVAENADDSYTQIQRFIRLTNLIPELQEFVDGGMIKMRPAVELSYLDEESQRDVVDMIDETEAFPSHDQAIRMRKAYEAGELDYDGVCKIMQEVKPNQKPIIKIPLERIEKVIPKRFDSKQTEDYIVKALEHYKKYLDRQREQAR
jgi:ParB family chromosome partitioning protein